MYFDQCIVYCNVKAWDGCPCDSGNSKWESIGSTTALIIRALLNNSTTTNAKHVLPFVLVVTPGKTLLRAWLDTSTPGNKQQMQSMFYLSSWL